jgi:hypothetical protein
MNLLTVITPPLVNRVPLPPRHGPEQLVSAMPGRSPYPPHSPGSLSALPPHTLLPRLYGCQKVWVIPVVGIGHHIVTMFPMRRPFSSVDYGPGIAFTKRFKGKVLVRRWIFLHGGKRLGPCEELRSGEKIYRRKKAGHAMPS